MQLPTAALAAVAIFAGQALAGCSNQQPKDFGNQRPCTASGDDWTCADASIKNNAGTFTFTTTETPLALQATCSSPMSGGGFVNQIVTYYCDARSGGTFELGCDGGTLSIVYTHKLN
ncbi:hypothetical protein E4U42_006376 [Claviceps africana]|uniref:Uncharacterized protein n=1 Tax=Claviceps africana TaxID=83212 RepID=A0A8K0J8G2_9HYPO|nr:hypothetical protein E4U42_006376 [Claviceps africana]